MSEKLKGNLTMISLILGILVGVFGFIGAWTVIPYRLESAEKSIHALQLRTAQDREILIRIEERQIEFNRKLERITR
jgi:hypothetical protein